MVLFCIDSGWLTPIAQIIIAAVALLGGLFRSVGRFLLRPKIVLLKSERYDFHMPRSEIPLASGMVSGESIEYLCAVSNVGWSVGKSCLASIDCILRKGDDGDSLTPRYFGMPIQLRWHPSKSTKDIPGRSVAYFRLISFVDGRQVENMAGTDAECVKQCALVYEGEDEIMQRLSLSIGQPFTVLIRVSVRAHNTKSAHADWLLIHWAGENEVTQKTFRMRRAKRDERKQAAREYKALVEKGEAI